VASDATASDATASVGIRSPWPALIVILSGSFMAVLDTFIVLVASPAIQSSLHASDAQVQLIIAGYQVTYAVALITGARLGDRYGRKRLFMLGTAAFIVSSVACASAPDATALVAARLVQGLSAALMFPQVFSMIQVLFPPAQRPRAFGALGATIGISTTVGQLVGGALIAANLFGTTWRPVFWVNVPVGLAALALAAWLVPESKLKDSRRLDLPGAVVLTVALFLLVTPLVQGREAGWPAWTWLSLAASAVAFVGFAVVERQVQKAGGMPLVAPQMFRERPFIVGMLLVVIAYAGVNSFFLILSLTLQNGLGQSALGAGLAYTPLAIAFFLASLAAGRLAAKLGRQVLLIGGATAALGFAATLAVAFTSSDHLTVSRLLGPLILVGLGNGLLLPQLLNAVLARIQPSEVGMASGVLSTGQQVGGAVGVAVIGILFFGELGSHGHGIAAFSDAFGTAVALNLAIAAAVTVLVCALPRPAKQS
jgi:EmrB/QacA subfamily drug resistance transporter